MARTTVWTKSLRTKGLPLLLMATLLMPLSGGVAHARQNAVEVESARTWVGKKAKPFTLTGIDGKPVNLARDFGRHPVVLVFYRGVW